MPIESPQLPYLSSSLRLSVYQQIVGGCSHLWSKGIIQNGQIVERKRKGQDGEIEIVEEQQDQRLQPVLQTLVKLSQEDPYFLAHLVSWAIKRPSKDLKVLTTYANSLSVADGTPFSAGSKYFKPNLRYVSAASVQELPPKLALRIAQLGSLKFSVPELINEASHFPTSLKTALRKYILFREANLNIVRGIKKAGLGNTYMTLYRVLRMAPSDEAAAALRWNQRDRKISFEEDPFDFKGLKDIEIAEKIRKDRLPALGVLSVLDKLSPVIAVALLEQVTGNQAVILCKMFEDQGILEDEEVMNLYKEKIKGAKIALDRVASFSKDTSKAISRTLKEARSKTRKKEMEDLGKVYLHLDFSGSMDTVLQFAIDRGSILAECVNNPKERFRWGIFGSAGEELPLPDEFVADAFASALFGRTTMGSTDAFALYGTAREFGAEVDVFVSDQEHNVGNLELKIRNYHESNELPKPKACVVVAFPGEDVIKQAYEANGIPVAILKPDTLVDAALVVTAVKEAMKGPMAVIDEILETPLLELPAWYYTI